MSQFSEIVADVYTITNRQDLVAETALAVRQSTLAVHRSDYYPKDVQELAVPFVTPVASFQIDIPSVFPNWRNFSYIRPWDPITGSPSSILLSDIRPDVIF